MQDPRIVENPVPSVQMLAAGDTPESDTVTGVTPHPSGLNRAQRRALYRQHRGR